MKFGSLISTGTWIMEIGTLSNRQTPFWLVQARSPIPPASPSPGRPVKLIRRVTPALGTGLPSASTTTAPRVQAACNLAVKFGPSTFTPFQMVLQRRIRACESR